MTNHFTPATDDSSSIHDKWLSPFHHDKPFHPCCPRQTIVPLYPMTKTSARMLPWETMTIKALWQTVTTMPPSWFIPSMPQWETIWRRSSMTNRFTHSTYDEPFHLCYNWQNISPMLPITNCCTNVIYDKPPDPYMLPWEAIAAMPPTQTISAKPSMITIPAFHPWQTISPKLPMTNYFTFCHPLQTISSIPHMKKTLEPCPHDKPLQLCYHQKPFLPYNPWQTISPILPWQITSTMPPMTTYFTSSVPEYHGSYSTRTNYFTRVTHHKPSRPFNPWHTIYQWTKKVFHPPNVSLQRRDISHSLLFWQWLGSCRYRFATPSPLSCLWITRHCI